MSKKKGGYHEEFPVGSVVQIADLETLTRFANEWKYHHPLEQIQLKYAGRSAIVASVTFYHGGDELYELIDIPGIWHEECLQSQVKSKISSEQVRS